MTEPAVLAKGPREDFDAGLDGRDIEWQTDKALVKICACTGCGAPVGVNTFYAPAIAKCSECGHQARNAGTGQSAIVQAGRTDPEKAVNLADCLLNKGFAFAMCPMSPDHVMELKSVSHSPTYGPSRRTDSGWLNDTGETVMHQCGTCKTTVAYSTTAQMVYRRLNAPRTASGDPSAWEKLLGPAE